MCFSLLFFSLVHIKPPWIDIYFSVYLYVYGLFKSLAFTVNSSKRYPQGMILVGKETWPLHLDLSTKVAIFASGMPVLNWLSWLLFEGRKGG